MENHIKLYIISRITPIYNGLYINIDESDDFIISEDIFVENVRHNLKANFNINKSDTENDSEVTDSCNKNGKGKRNSLTNGELTPQIDLCPCIRNVDYYSFHRKMKIRLDGLLFSNVIDELRRTKVFRKNLLLKIYAHYYSAEKDTLQQQNLCDLCGNDIWTIRVFAALKNPKKFILDHKWNEKVETLVYERCELENTMAWLSTLGGAFSALGDTYIDCAEKAGVISMQQLQLAMRLGDPLTICRCKIYLAMSLLQRGYYSQTKTLIRELYKFSTEGEGKKDFRLRNMCLAVWNRLKYLLSQKNVPVCNKRYITCR